MNTPLNSSYLFTMTSDDGCEQKAYHWQGLSSPKNAPFSRADLREKNDPQKIIDTTFNAFGKDWRPDVFCILGRGIEQQKNGNWRPTTIFEKMHITNPTYKIYGHTGHAQDTIDMNADDIRIGGANLNVHAASNLLFSLYQNEVLPKTIFFSAGRPNYIAELDPEGTLSESDVLCKKLFNKVYAKIGSETLNPNTFSFETIKNTQGQSIYDVASFGDRNVVKAKYNTNSVDDLRAAIYYAQQNGQKNVAFLTIRHHAIRCNEVLNFWYRNKDPVVEGVDARMITAEKIMSAYRPGYGKIARAIEDTQPSRWHAAAEIRGAYLIIEQSYDSTQTAQKNTLFPMLHDS